MKREALILIALAGLALAACGRSGAPYTPSEAARMDAKAQGRPAPEPPVKNAANPDKRFLLDGLLE